MKESVRTGFLHLFSLYAITDCENAASVALLERLGMRREGHFLLNVCLRESGGTSICTPFSKGMAAQAQPNGAGVKGSGCHITSKYLHSPHHLPLDALEKSLA